MTETQYIYGDDGERKYAILPIENYETLLRMAEDAEDAALVEATRHDRLIPGEVVHRIADGISPVRVWREHRGLSQAELGRRAGFSQVYISRIERGKTPGSFKAHAALARVLEIELDDLAPPEG